VTPSFVVICMLYLIGACYECAVMGCQPTQKHGFAIGMHEFGRLVQPWGCAGSEVVH
jgi:hypothetical protein